MGSSCDHNTLISPVRWLERDSTWYAVTYEYKEQSGQDDTNPSSEIIDTKPKEEHTKDVSDQDRV
jgi:hypothetical protein